MARRVVRFHELGGPGVLRLEAEEERSPQRNELRLRVEAFALNRSDVQYRRGEYIERPAFPARLGYEATGVVEAVGADVRAFAIGDRVSTLPAFSLNEYAVAGETAIVPVHAVTRCPHNVSAEEAASVWMAYLTAVGSLAEVRADFGAWALITAASGGVGTAAIQVARSLGLRVIATTRHSPKMAGLRALGADVVLDTSREDVSSAVADVTSGRGADVVLDSMAGAHVEALAVAAAPGAVFTLYGYFAGISTPLPLVPFLLKGLTFRSFNVFRLTADAPRLERTKRVILDGLARGTFRPIVDRVFGIEEIAAAHEYLESNRQVGKVVVRI